MNHIVHFVCSDGQIEIWKMNGGPLKLLCVFDGHTHGSGSKYVKGLAIDERGNRLFSGAWDRHLCAWDLPRLFQMRPLGHRKVFLLLYL